MKKLLAAVSALALFLSMTACGDDTAETQPTVAADTQATTAQTAPPTEGTTAPEQLDIHGPLLDFYNTVYTARNIETLRTVATEDTTDEALQTIVEDNEIRKKQQPEQAVPMDMVDMAQIVDQFEDYTVIRYRLSNCDNGATTGTQFVAVKTENDRFISNFNLDFLQQIKDAYVNCITCEGTGLCTVPSKIPCQHCEIADTMSYNRYDYRIIPLTNGDNVTGGDQFVVENMPDGSGTEPTTGSTEPSETTPETTPETLPTTPPPKCPYCMDTGYGTEEEACVDCDGKGYYCFR